MTQSRQFLFLILGILCCGFIAGSCNKQWNELKDSIAKEQSSKKKFSDRVQRMLLYPGEYKLGKKYTVIFASCIDGKAPIPKRRDAYYCGGPFVRVQRWGGDGMQDHSVAWAVARRWLQIHGNGNGHSVRLRSLISDKLVLVVGEHGVIGQSMDSVLDATDRLLSPQVREARSAYDELCKSLKPLARDHRWFTSLLQRADRDVAGRLMEDAVEKYYYTDVLRDTLWDSMGLGERPKTNTRFANGAVPILDLLSLCLGQLPNRDEVKALEEVFRLELGAATGRLDQAVRVVHCDEQWEITTTKSRLQIKDKDFSPELLQKAVKNRFPVIIDKAAAADALLLNSLAKAGVPFATTLTAQVNSIRRGAKQIQPRLMAAKEAYPVSQLYPGRRTAEIVAATKRAETLGISVLASFSDLLHWLRGLPGQDHGVVVGFSRAAWVRSNKLSRIKTEENADVVDLAVRDLGDKLSMRIGDKKLEKLMQHMHARDSDHFSDLVSVLAKVPVKEPQESATYLAALSQEYQAERRRQGRERSGLCLAVDLPKSSSTLLTMILAVEEEAQAEDELAGGKGNMDQD